MNNYNYISLFAGAGGLSEGFIRQGFSPISHVESDGAACFTLKTRTAYHYLLNEGREGLYYSYIKGEISRDELYSSVPGEILNSVINAEIGRENERIFQIIDSRIKGETVDLIIGGPPCQAYSVVGSAPLKTNNNDERTRLYIDRKSD